MPDVKRVALYMRYSTHQQDGNYSIEIQLERMKASCISKGWKFDDDSIFIDAAYSGANMDRPALQNLLSRLDEFDVVMVYRLDRLSRSQRDTMTLIQDYFLKSDTAFVSVSETLDTTTPFGMAMIGILAVFAELERATITERMQSGIKKKVAAGYRINGGNRPPTGYKYKKSEQGLLLVPDAYEAELIKKIFDYFERYHSVARVQDKLKEEGFNKRKFNTIIGILSNRLYLGEVVYLGESYLGVHKALIDNEQFDRVQKILEARPKGTNHGKNKESLFGGLIQCAKCGENYAAYSYKVKNVKKGDYYVRSYVCNARRYPVHYDEKCLNKTYKNDILEQYFMNELNLFVKAKQSEIQKPDTKINYDLILRRIDDKISRLLDLYEDGEISKATLNNRLAKRNKEKEDILSKRKSESQNEAIQIDLSRLKEYVVNFSQMDFKDKRAIVEKLLRRILIDGENIIFEWNF